MAIKGFKEIVDKKGYKVNAKDRAIFEREVGKAYFGLGISDMIEFILFDSNDNQLPQGDSGEMVRYIHLDNENIRKYFLLTNNSSNKRLNGADEYIIDTEKLITEAGYSNGIFKTQVNLLNRRVGSEDIAKDKLWIHEISPTRTEIRVLPLEDENEKVYEDLQQRLNLVLNGGNFRDDTIYFVKAMVESIKVEDVLKTFLTLKGTVSEGETYIKLIQSEFKIQNWELFIKQVREKLVEGAQYYIENKDYNITSNTYGKPTSSKVNVELSIGEITEKLNSILINVLNKYLPSQSIQQENILTKSEQQTLDNVSEILKTITSGAQYQANALQNKQGIVRGCMDKNALNYNPLAQEDDGSCVYQSVSVGTPTPKTPIPPSKPSPKIIDKTWYGWATTSTIKYTDKNGNTTQTKINEYDYQQLSYVDGSISVDGDVRETPKEKQPQPTVQPAPSTGGSGGGGTNYYGGGGGGYGSGGDATFSNANYLGNKDNMFNIR